MFFFFFEKSKGVLHMTDLANEELKIYIKCEYIFARAFRIDRSNEKNA